MKGEIRDFNQWRWNDLFILGMVKRDTITDIKDSVGNILGVNKEESLLDYIEDEIDTQLDVDVSIFNCSFKDLCIVKLLMIITFFLITAQQILHQGWQLCAVCSVLQHSHHQALRDVWVSHLVLDSGGRGLEPHLRILPLLPPVLPLQVQVTTQILKIILAKDLMNHLATRH